VIKRNIGLIGTGIAINKVMNERVARRLRRKTTNGKRSELKKKGQIKRECRPSKTLAIRCKLREGTGGKGESSNCAETVCRGNIKGSGGKLCGEIPQRKII